MGKILQGHSLWFHPSPDWQLAPHACKLPFLIRKMTPRKMNLLLKRQKWYWGRCGKCLTLASNLSVTDTQDATSEKRTWLKGWRDHSSSSNTFATYIHIYFKWNFPSGLIMLSTKATDDVSKAPTPFWVVGKSCSRDSPPHYGLLLLYVVTSQRWKVRSYCWRHYELQTQDLEDLSWIWPGSLLPEDNYHGTRRCHVSFQRREATNPWYPRTSTTTSIANNPRGTIGACIPWW